MANRINLTRELRIEEFTTNEFLAFLASQFSSWSLAADHAIAFDDDVLVTFKSSERKILKVEVARSARRRLVEKVGVALAPDVSPAVASRTVMSEGGFRLKPFRWRGKWQVGRMPTPAPVPDELIGLFPVLLQFQYRKVGMGWLDAARRDLAFRRAFLPLVPISRLVCDGLVDPSHHTAQKAWVHTSDGKDSAYPINRWAQMGYIIPPDLISDDVFHEYASPPVSDWSLKSVEHADFCRSRIEPWLDLVDKLTVGDELVFHRGCHWLNKAYTARTGTDALLAFVTMVEALLPVASGKPCDECGNRKYDVSERFYDFICTYGVNVEADEDQRAEQSRFARKLYALRSVVAHRGYAVAAEDLGFGVGFVPKDLTDQDLVSHAHSMGHKLLLSWLRDLSTRTCTAEAAEHES